MNFIVNTINSIITWFYNELVESNNNLPACSVMEEPIAFANDVEDDYDIHFDYFGDQLV